MNKPILTPLEVLQLFPPHDLTLGYFLDVRVEVDPDKAMLIFAERTWSRAEVLAESRRLAARLQGEGVKKGDRVIVAGRNSAWHVFALIACGLTGAIFVPVNPQLTVGELGYILGNARPALVLCADELQEICAQAMQESCQTAPLLTLNDALVEAVDTPLAAVAIAATDPLLMIYTSGTTGFPKGVLHSHQSFILAGEAFIGRMHLQPDERMLLILPMFHINALFYSVSGAFAAGATLIVEERFSASRFWNVAVRHRATQVNMIEAVVSILLTRPEEEYRPEHTIRKAYGIRQAMVERVQKKFGITHAIGGYGMTEIPGVISTPFGMVAPVGSMGQLCAHPDPARDWAECRVVDDDGADLPDGEIGELWVKTPVRMLEYFGDPEQTAASFSDGWFRTGDLVRRDQEGNFFFSARKKDIIRVRGENVSGAEVDRVLLQHPDVEIAAAIGVPGAMGDEDIFAAVKLRDGAEVTPDDLKDWCGKHLAAIKVPSYVALMNELPLTPTHKVQKVKLKEQVLNSDYRKAG
ncbi:class I adenylate-forming enzyme family protein [Daeguia caeni]|uniref:Class I adenylate-forming enzyme family protein n=1 Tax=Daeguia caeni TaxID=439612 RepID=A0ABV9H992_9HYPH